MVAKPNISTAPHSSDVDLGLDSDEADVVQSLRSIASWPSLADRYERSVVKLLRETHSDRVRNAAAIALVDLEPAGAAEVLIDILRRPEMARSSGTIIYALDELGASIPFGVLARLLERGSYEARAQALPFFEEHRITYSDELDTQEGHRILSALAASDDPEAAEAGSLALQFIDPEEPIPSI